MPAPEFRPGFRLSTIDVLVLCAGITAVAFFAGKVPWISAVIAMTVGHFFLFCNVFRISRATELIWATIFLVLCGATIETGQPGLPVAFAGSIALSAGLIWRETRQPGYHGICWRRWNPGLPSWWQARQGKA